MLTAIRQWVIKTMMRGQTGVVQTLPRKELIELNTQITAERIMRNGINPDDLKTVGQVENVVEQIDTPKVISADSAKGKGITEQFLGKKKADVMDMEGNKIDTSKGIMGGKELPGETNIFSNQYLNDLDKKIIDSDAFGYTQKEWNNLSTSSKEKFRKQFDSNYEDAMENTEMAPIKPVESDAVIKARLDAGNKKGIAGIKKKNRESMPIRLMKNFEKELNQTDLMAEGYSKDQANVLIKARKKMTSGEEMNPNESLLRVKEEFADNAGVDVDDFTDIDFEIDVPEYADGGRIGLKGGMTKRAFMKLMGGVGASIGAAKSGIFSGFGKGAGKTVAKEVAQQTTSSMPPPYFFKLAEKIKMMGADSTATTERVIAKSLKSKDGKSEYLLEEDMVTGDTIIKKINKEGDEMVTDVEIMELRKGEVVQGKDGKPIKVPDEYEEVTEANMRIEGDVYNDPYYTDGIQVDDIIKEVDDTTPSIKYASGGLAYMLGE